MEPRVRWACRLRPELLARLYQADASGLHDSELCDRVGMTLFERCRTLLLVSERRVVCPACLAEFQVALDGISRCPGASCEWSIGWAGYQQSVRNHHAKSGRALEAYAGFLKGYPAARDYRARLLQIDRLIHSFHVDEKTQAPVKSVASKLLEGNKKAVVRFLDELSALDPAEKGRWRDVVAKTIDARVLRSVPPE